MRKHEILSAIYSVGVVAVVRASDSEDAMKIAKACIEGGISAIEITFTVPRADNVIKHLASSVPKNSLIIGAGTVLDSETARLAIMAGAKFIVSPSFSHETATLCNRYGIPYFPGCLSITEMVRALESGCDLVKLFPGSAFGPSYIKAVRGPLPYVNIMPTGGVSLGNVHEWISNGSFAVGIGSELTKPAQTGNYAGVTDLAKQYVRAVKEARKNS